MTLDTVTLQCFLAVAETQSFTKAALTVGRTQSAVSQQIAKLENLFAKHLILRGKQLSLTPDGEIFLGYAKRIYELHRESLDIFKTPEIHGELRFGLPEDFASIMLSDILVEFSRLHPRVMLNVECDLTLNLIERFHKGEFDLILIKSNEKNQISAGVHVWHEAVDWVGKKELLPPLQVTNTKPITKLAAKSELQKNYARKTELCAPVVEDSSAGSTQQVAFAKDFGRQSIIPLILSPAPCVYRGNVIESLNKNGLKWRLAFSSPSYTGKMAAVKAGLGITAIQRSMIPSYLDRLDYDFLPSLNPIQVTLIKKKGINKANDSLEFFIMNKLKKSGA